jgi:hypothetical protein
MLAQVYLQQSEPDGIPAVTLFTKREKSERYRRYDDEWYGWMNFGDLVWEDTYCSLHYDAPHGMLSQFLRLGHRGLFDVGEQMAMHRADVDQNHSSREARAVFGTARYEKSTSPEVHFGGYRGKFSHTWVEGMLLHYLLTGDRHSLDAARMAAEGARRRWTWDGLGQKRFTRETRTPGWAMLALLACYRVDADPKWREAAEDIFLNDLLHGEQLSGGEGFWATDERNPRSMSMVMFGYTSNAVMTLAHEFEHPEARKLVVRMADFLIHRAGRGGVAEGDLYRPFGQASPWVEDPLDGTPEGRRRLGTAVRESAFLPDLLTAAAVVTGRREYLDWADTAFRDMTFYYQGRAGEPIDPARRSPLTYQPRYFPGSETKSNKVFRTSHTYLHHLAGRRQRGE